jgi:hypothetical protein
VQYLYDYDLYSEEPHVTSFRRIASVVFASLLAAPSLVEAQTALQYRWKQGDVVVYRNSLKTASTMSGIASLPEVTIEQTMTQQIRLLAAAVSPDGSVTLHQTTEAVRVEMAAPAGKVVYDSADPKSAGDNEGSAALAKVFGGVVGATISITMAPNGAVQRVDGIQRVLDKILQDAPEERRTAALMQSLKSVLSDEAVRASLEQSFPRMPPQPVKPGDTWTGKIALGSSAIGRISGTQTFTLKSVDGNRATIAVALALKQESTPPMGPSGMTVKLGDAKGEGEIDFDAASGRIRRSTMQTEMPSTMTTVTPDGQPATMKNLTKTSMTMELVEKQEAE